MTRKLKVGDVVTYQGCDDSWQDLPAVVISIDREHPYILFFDECVREEYPDGYSIHPTNVKLIEEASDV